LPISRDHKRLGDGDAGPNTGGMGAVSPLPDLPDAGADAILDAFHRPVLAELARRGTPFRGVLYAGLMLTADGPRLLEFNARFGDPETQVIVPRLAVPLGPLLLAAARGALGDDAPLPTLPGTTVGIVLAAAGYPSAPRTGDPIAGLDAALAAGSLVFHAATHAGDDGWTTAGGRVLTVVGRGSDLAAARDAAEAAAERIAWPGMQRRRDIGGELRVTAGAPA
jgi:phosphoribosylamine---glycine ligase